MEQPEHSKSCIHKVLVQVHRKLAHIHMMVQVQHNHRLALEHRKLVRSKELHHSRRNRHRSHRTAWKAVRRRHHTMVQHIRSLAREHHRLARSMELERRKLVRIRKMVQVQHIRTLVLEHRKLVRSKEPHHSHRSNRPSY